MCRRLRWFGGPLLLTLVLLAHPTGAQPQNDAADTARLFAVLGLQPGSVVADIGAGGGLLTIPIARAVGAGGRVYATDINPQRLEDLRVAVTGASLTNVIVVEGGSTRTSLPDSCCDAAFMRHVYHHLGDPPLMNASIFRSLKPGAHLAIVDFAPQSGASAPAGRRDDGDRHGVMPDTVIAELTAAGFTGVEQLPWSSPGYFLVVARRP